MMLPHTLRAVFVALLPAVVLISTLISTTSLPAAASEQGGSGPRRMTLEARFEPASARPGDTVTLVLKGQITPGYHVYGAMEETGIVPSFVGGPALLASLEPKGKLVVPDGRLHIEPSLPDLQSYWIEGKATFEQAFVVKSGTAPGEVSLGGGLKYMACTPEMCDPPLTQKFAAKLTVLPRAPGKPSGAQDRQLPSVHNGNHQVMEVVLVPATARPGETVRVEVRVAMGKGWHNYGSQQNPEFGEPVSMKVTGKGLGMAGAAVIPQGEPHDIVGDTYYFLVGEWVMHQTVTVPKDAKPGPLDIGVAVAYTACDDSTCDAPVKTAIGARLVVEAGAARAAHVDVAKTDAAKASAAPQDKKLDSVHVGKHQEMRVVLVPDTARAGEVVTVEVHVKMEGGWHNYGAKQNPEFGEPVTMTASGGGLTATGATVVPAGEPREIVGDTYYFLEGEWVMRQRLRVAQGRDPGAIEIKVDLGYTACDDSICDDDVATAIGATLTIEAGAVRAAFAGESEGETGNTGETGKNGEDDGGEPELNDMPLFLYLLGAVGAGLFALIMPCTYPMIPLTVSFFTKQAEAKGGRPVFLALVYGGGIIASYLVLGGVFGSWMGKIAADPWLNIVIGVAFVFFAMSLFGLVELKPPQFLMNSATRTQQIATGSGSVVSAIAGVFLMGVTLCVTSFACTAPFLGLMLAAGANSGGTGRMLLGMGVFGLTMALPFVVLSLVPGKLPKSGGWMNSAKIMFGFVELAAALKFFSNSELAWNWLILPRELFLMIWAVLFLVASIYMLGLIKMKGETGEIGGGRLVVGTVVLLLASYFGLGASGYPLDNQIMNAFNPPYSDAAPGHRSGNANGNSEKTVGHTIIVDDFDRGVEVAKAAEKLLLVNFTGLV